MTLRTLPASLTLGLFLACAAAAPALAADSGWTFSSGYAPLVGLRAEFGSVGTFNNPFAPLPAPGPGQNYVYSNGFVQVDSSGNAGGVTTFFGYTTNAQYDPAGNGGLGTLSYTAVADRSVNAGTVEESRIASAGGFDLSAARHLGSVAFFSGAGGRSAGWGVRLGAQYNRIEVGNQDSLGASVTTITDVFSAGGAPLPAAPYTGTFFGPGPLLDDSPITRTVGTATALFNGTRRLDVHLLSTQYGAYLEIPVTPKLDVVVEGGFMLALATGSYRNNTTVDVAGYATQTSSAYERRTRLLPGVYAAAGLKYHLNEKIALQGSVRYQFLKEFEMNAGGSSASVAFNTAFTLSAGVVVRF